MAKEIRLPDIGDFKDVPIIEILVAPGQSVRKDETILTLESDKASMDVPAPEDGVIGEIASRSATRSPRATCWRPMRAAERRRGAPSRQDRRPPTPKAAASKSGARPQGCRARRSTAEAAADPGARPISRPKSWSGRGSRRLHRRLPRRRSRAEGRSGRRAPTLGGVCLNVGCIPSKALLHVAKVIDDAKAMGSHGVSFGAPTFELSHPRLEGGVVKRLTGGLVGLAKQRKVKTVTGEGKFTSPNTLRVETAEGRRSCVSTRRSSRPAPSRPRRDSSPPTRASGIRPRRSR